MGVSLNEKQQPGFVKMAVGENSNHEMLAAFAEGHIEEGAAVSSDVYTSYLKAFASGEYIHQPKKFNKASEEHLKWLRVFVSNAKRFILGTCHGLGG